MPNRKKILIIPSWYPTIQNPLAGSFFQEQAQLLSKNFNIKVLFGQPQEVSKIEFGIIKLKIKLGRLLVAIAPNPIGAPEAWTFQYPQSKYFSEEKNAFVMFQYYLEAFKVLCEKWKPDLLHAQSVRYGGMISNYISRATNTTYIITEHAGIAFWLENYNPFRKEQMAITYESAATVVVVSHSKMGEILSLGFRCKPIVVGNYIDERIFTISSTISTDASFQLLIVAHEPINKDLETLLLALNELVKNGERHTHLTIIGMLPEKDKYIQILLEQFSSILSYVTFIPSVGRENMPVYYQKCDLFVSTSINESFGLSVAEAIMCGKPVVVTRSGGIDDIVDNTNGLKVHIRDWKALAEAILKIKNKEVTFDPEKARKGIIDKFGATAFLNRMTNIYQQAIEKK